MVFDPRVRQVADPLEKVEPVADAKDLLEMQAQVRDVQVKEPVARYLLRVVAATRAHRDLELGVSPRGALAYFRAAQARALLQGRAYVTPDDIQVLAAPVLAHRVLLTAQSRYGGATRETIVAGIVKGVDVPT